MTRLWKMNRTIHEFPSYSFVLGDLHAHVVNVMFVLLVLGLLYSYVKNTCRDPEKEWKWSLKDVLLQPQIIAAGFLIGVFHWSNYWDFVIYFVVIAGFSLYWDAVPVSCAGERDDRNGSPAGCRSFCNWNDWSPFRLQ